jgi:hypothetical protein
LTFIAANLCPRSAELRKDQVADRWTEAKWRDLEDQLGRTSGQIDSNGARDETTPMTAGLLARAPRATGKPRSTWIAVDKGWLK